MNGNVAKSDGSQVLWEIANAGIDVSNEEQK